MGWGKTLLLGSIGNQLNIDDLEGKILLLKGEVSGSFYRDMSQDEKIKKLIVENAELKLYVTSLICLLVKKGNISKEELQTVVTAIDGEDGSLDGKYEGEIV